jgi:hypothetical protein
MTKVQTHDFLPSDIVPPFVLSTVEVTITMETAICTIYHQHGVAW